MFGTAGKQRLFPLDLQSPGHYEITFSYLRKMGGVLGGFLAGLKGGVTGAPVETHNLPTEVHVNRSPQARRLPGAVQIDPTAEPTEAEEGLVPKMFRERREAARQGHLVGLWEPTDGTGLSFLFTKDGGMFRSDGFGTKYRWLPEDRVELYDDECEQTVQFQVLSLSPLELILKTDGQAGHFKRGVTITEAEMRRRREAADKALKEMGRTAAKVAGGAAAVLALGGLAVLCGVGALASLDSPGGGLAGDSGLDAASGREQSAGSAAGSQSGSQRSQVRMRQAAALVGARIVSQDGSTVVFKKVCERCGNVEPGTTSMSIGSGITSAAFQCSKCRNMQPYQIQFS